MASSISRSQLMGPTFNMSSGRRPVRELQAGERISYGELARRIGRPSASRAVGHANARNPISIIVPCHRVIGASGSLTGFGGGLGRKQWLLEHETRFVTQPELETTLSVGNQALLF